MPRSNQPTFLKTLCVGIACLLLFAHPNPPRALASPSPNPNTPQQAIEPADLDALGQLRAIVDWPASIWARSSVWVVQQDWRRITQQWNLIDTQWNSDGTQLSATFPLDSSPLLLQQTHRPQPGRSRLSYQLSTQQPIDLNGIFWFLDLRVEDFRNGEIEVDDQRFSLPADFQTKELGSARASKLTIRSRDNLKQITLNFGTPREVRLQDARAFGPTNDVFQVFVQFHAGPIAPIGPATFDVDVSATLRPAAEPIRLDLSADKISHRFEGVGGNFVYAIDHPATRKNLAELSPTWVRIGMDLRDWEPTNDNDDPNDFLPPPLNRDSPESLRLRQRFTLDQELARRAHGNVIASVWYPPEWLMDQPHHDPQRWREHPGTIARHRWPELIESILTYLLHLKSIGCEPKLFSFNESDLGVYLKLDGESKRDLYRALGEAFARAGLSTKLLLGDSASLREGWEQIQPTLHDPEVMKYIGAIAYHVWSGERDMWDNWSNLARQLDLPLLVTEAGVDAGAWRNHAFNRPINALRSADRYVRLISEGRAQALLEWEWTGDYSIFEQRDQRLLYTSRARLIRQLHDLTPRPASVMQISPHPDVACVVLQCTHDSKSDIALTIHLVNTGPARDITLQNINLDNIISSERSTPVQFDVHLLDFASPPTESISSVADQILEAKEKTIALRLPAGAMVSLVVRDQPRK